MNESITEYTEDVKRLRKMSAENVGLASVGVGSVVVGVVTMAHEAAVHHGDLYKGSGWFGVFMTGAGMVATIRSSLHAMKQSHRADAIENALIQHELSQASEAPTAESEA